MEFDKKYRERETAKSLKTKPYTPKELEDIRVMIKTYFTEMHPNVSLNTSEGNYQSLVDEINSAWKGNILTARFICDIYNANGDTSNKNIKRMNALEGHLKSFIDQRIAKKWDDNNDTLQHEPLSQVDAEKLSDGASLKQDSFVTIEQNDIQQGQKRKISASDRTGVNRWLFLLLEIFRKNLIYVVVIVVSLSAGLFFLTEKKWRSERVIPGLWNSAIKDCMTIAVANYTSNTGYDLPCWTNTTIYAKPGDRINIRIYYHNSSDIFGPTTTALNTRIVLNAVTEPSTVHTFSGQIISDQGGLPFGPITVNLSSVQPLVYGTVRWLPNQTQNPAEFINGQNGSELISGGLEIGDVAPGWSSQGSIGIDFTVGSASTPNLSSSERLWNGSGSNNCPTIAVANASTQVGIGNPCWPNVSVSANPGDYVDVKLFYHNTSGNINATNTRIVLNAPTGSSISHLLTGQIISDQGNLSFGPATINLSSAQTLTIGAVSWRASPHKAPSHLLNGQNGHEVINGGLDIGTIPPTGDNQGGSVVVSFAIEKTSFSN